MSNTTAVAPRSAKFLNGGSDIGVQRHPETKSTWALPFARAFTRSLAPCRHSLPPPWRSTLPVIEETSLVSFGHHVVRDRPVLLGSHQLFCISVSVSVSLRPSAPPIPVFTTQTSSPQPPCLLVPGWRGGVSNPGKLCFARRGEGSLVARTLARPLPHPRTRPGSAPRAAGAGHEDARTGTRREHGEPDQVARCKRARAGPCRSPGAGPASDEPWKRPPSPPRAAPPPIETDQALGWVVIVLVFPPQFPAGVGNSLPGGRPGSALSIRRNKRLVCLGRCSYCSLGERLKQGPSEQEIAT